MKQWVSNRLIDINRLTNRENCFHMESGNMTVNLGTTWPTLNTAGYVT